MATAYEIADLLTQGMQGPVGADDSGWHVGKILTWSSSTGLNSVLVNGVPLTNLKALTPSIGTEYAPGQTVLIVRKQTQYFILGPVTTPGAVGSTPPTQVDGTGGTMSPAAGSNVWRDLDGGASLSPSFNIKLAPFQRCLFMFGSKGVTNWGCILDMSLVVTGPTGNNLLSNPGVRNGQTTSSANQISISNYTQIPMFKTYFAQAASADANPTENDVVPGTNGISLKYRVLTAAGAAGAGTPTTTVGTPWLLAVPF